jgi:hypothetical protein
VHILTLSLTQLNLVLDNQSSSNVLLGSLPHPGKAWKGDLELQRALFDKIAHSEGFNPVEEPHKWSFFTRPDIQKYKV